MSPEVVIRVTRPAMHAGQRVEAGETLRLPALQAGQFVDSGKAELCHAGDLGTVRQAQRDDLHRALRALGPVRRPDVPASPWRPR